MRLHARKARQRREAVNGCRVTGARESLPPGWMTRFFVLAWLASATGCCAALVGCSGSDRANPAGSSSANSCEPPGDGALVPLAADAKAADVSVTGPLPADGDAGPTTGETASTTGDADAAAPDPANWGCYVDSDCSVFPVNRYCEGNRCVTATESVACTSGVVSSMSSPEVRHTYTGTNGTFADACDAQGNLIQYSCVTTLECLTDEAPNAPCYTYDTGPVASPSHVDCVGGCVDGRCDARCPQQGDQVTFTQVFNDGSVVVRNDSDGRSYNCAAAAPTCTVAAGQVGRVSPLCQRSCRPPRSGVSASRSGGESSESRGLHG